VNGRMMRRWPKPLVREGIQAIVFTTINAEPTLWDAILPEAALRLPRGLGEIDRVLDDPRFFEPFRPFFSARHGRPSIPMETYLRMMFLRFRYKLGFETLCAEVSDSIAWRRFCRIPLDAQVPHPTTLIKITSRCGTKAVDGLNEALLAKAAEEKLVRLDRVRADTTVVEANVAYPIDSGLLAKAVVSLVGLVMVIKAAGLARRTRFRDRRRSVRRRAHEVAVWLRRRNDDAKEEVLVITGELATLAELTITEARMVAVNARRALARRNGDSPSGRVRRALADIDRIGSLAEQIVAQTRCRLSGEVPDGASRVVSLHDPDARPIREGGLGRPAGRVRLQSPDR
jgi:IS5 family transposase